MRTALILAAHGSRLQTSNDEVVEIANSLADSLHISSGSIYAAFLELATPSIEESIDSAVADGHEQLTIIPYFLAAGRHVRADVPEIVSLARQKYPNIQIRLTEHLGLSPLLNKAIRALL